MQSTKRKSDKVVFPISVFEIATVIGDISQFLQFIFLGARILEETE